MSTLLLTLAMALLGGQKAPFAAQPDIYLEIVAAPGYEGPVFFFAPHENEHVANVYLAEKIRQTGRGRFVVLRQNGERHVTLRTAGGAWELDPNRMFTDRGAEHSLLKLNPALREGSAQLTAALLLARQLGDFVLSRIGDLAPGTIIVAMHNNTDGYDDDGKGGVGTVSIKRYARKLANGANFIKAVYEGEGDEDNLFFITSPEDFAAMKAAQWHTVLQHPQVAALPDEDDGSLSVLAEMKGLRYINIEAERHDPVSGVGRDLLEEQRRMVDLVWELTFANADPAR